MSLQYPHLFGDNPKVINFCLFHESYNIVLPVKPISLCIQCMCTGSLYHDIWTIPHYKLYYETWTIPHYYKLYEYELSHIVSYTMKHEPSLISYPMKSMKYEHKLSRIISYIKKYELSHIISIWNMNYPTL